VRKVHAWWLLRAPKSNAGSSSTAAYTKARQRLARETIRGIGEHLIEHLERRVPSSQLWLARRVRVVDGTTVSMPDTPANQKKYPQPSSQKAGCGFPQMCVVGHFSLASGALLDFAKSSIHVHESILFVQLMGHLEKKATSSWQTADSVRSTPSGRCRKPTLIPSCVSTAFERWTSAKAGSSALTTD
jgi:hypothetical protein